MNVSSLRTKSLLPASLIAFYLAPLSFLSSFLSPHRETRLANADAPPRPAKAPQLPSLAMIHAPVSLMLSFPPLPAFLFCLCTKNQLRCLSSSLFLKDGLQALGQCSQHLIRQSGSSRNCWTVSLRHFEHPKVHRCQDSPPGLLLQ